MHLICLNAIFYVVFMYIFYFHLSLCYFFLSDWIKRKHTLLHNRASLSQREYLSFYNAFSSILIYLEMYRIHFSSCAFLFESTLLINAFMRKIEIIYINKYFIIMCKNFLLLLFIDTKLPLILFFFKYLEII